MKKLLIGAIAIASLGIGQALAADLPYKSPPKPQTWSWTGCFIGANGGYAWGRERTTFTDNTPRSSASPRGGLGGGQVGCDYQMNQWVMGIEISYDWASINGPVTSTAGLAPGTYTWSTNYDGVGLFTTRTGMSFNNDMTLLYLRSGFAALHVKDRPFAVVPPPGTQNQQPHFEPGWDLGIGLEHRFTQNLSLRVEYNHMWFRHAAVDIQLPGPTTFIHPARTELDVVTVGVNYRFTPWAVSGKY